MPWTSGSTPVYIEACATGVTDSTVLQKGMTIAIEPMITAGRGDVKVGTNGWTVITADGSDAAHFERSVVIFDDGPEILTPWASQMS